MVAINEGTLARPAARRPPGTAAAQRAAVALGNYLGVVVLWGSPLLPELMADLFERVDDCYPCLRGMAASLLDNDAADHAGSPLARAGRGPAMTRP